MTAPSIEPAFRPDSQIAKRVIIGGCGVVLLGIALVVTLGTVLIGIAAITVAWFLKRRHGVALTRGSAWFISACTTLVPFLLLFLFTAFSGPAPTAAQRRQAVEASRAKRDSVPDWLKRITNQPGATPTADSVADRLLQHRGFVMWFSALAAVMASVVLAMFAGTFGWASWMLLFRATTGDWMRGGQLPGSIVEPPPGMNPA